MKYYRVKKMEDVFFKYDKKHMICTYMIVSSLVMNYTFF